MFGGFLTVLDTSAIDLAFGLGLPFMVYLFQVAVPGFILILAGTEGGKPWRFLQKRSGILRS